MILVMSKRELKLLQGQWVPSRTSAPRTKSTVSRVQMVESFSTPRSFGVSSDQPVCSLATHSMPNYNISGLLAPSCPSSCTLLLEDGPGLQLACSVRPSSSAVLAISLQPHHSTTSPGLLLVSSSTSTFVTSTGVGGCVSTTLHRLDWMLDLLFRPL